MRERKRRVLWADWRWFHKRRILDHRGFGICRKKKDYKVEVRHKGTEVRMLWPV